MNRKRRNAKAQSTIEALRCRPALAPTSWRIAIGRLLDVIVWVVQEIRKEIGA